ncbi:Uncharacterised protein [Mycobacteroides abscessus subsp. abscessus]|nr:Uncharacterised protein [Mycobacteroides abscessus subsp. abscessus]
MASSTPAWYGVAGSYVVETTSSLGSPAAWMGCGLLVGGTGQNAHTPSGAFPVNSP